jgi:hypothetical protein
MDNVQKHNICTFITTVTMLFWPSKFYGRKVVSFLNGNFISYLIAVSIRVNIRFSNIRHKKRINKKFWEELIAYFPITTEYSIRHGPHRKHSVQQLSNATWHGTWKQGQWSQKRWSLLRNCSVNTCPQQRIHTQKNSCGGHRHIQTARWSHNLPLIFLKIRKARQKCGLLSSGMLRRVIDDYRRFGGTHCMFQPEDGSSYVPLKLNIY